MAIISLASLAVRHLSTKQVELFWPDSQPGYRIETTGTLEVPAIWAPLNLPVATSGGQLRVAVDSTEDQRYFRLISP